MTNQLQDHNRVMVIFESPQSARARLKVTLERTQSSNLQNVDIDELKMLNPYNLLVTIPSNKLSNFSNYKIYSMA